MNTQTQEAFEKFWNTEIVSAVTGSVDTAMWGDIDRNDTAYIFMAGFKACKEALAHPAQDNEASSLREPVAWMDLHKELGFMKWIGADDGWDRAIEAVRKRLVELSTTKITNNPIAIVSEVYQSRYTIEWINGSFPQGTKLYTHPAPAIVQEPVAWVSPKTAYYFGITNKYETGVFRYGLFDDATIPLYTHPAPSWQGLSDDEISNIFISDKVNGNATRFARAIEQALKEKNSV